LDNKKKLDLIKGGAMPLLFLGDFMDELEKIRQLLEDNNIEFEECICEGGFDIIRSFRGKYDDGWQWIADFNISYGAFDCYGPPFWFIGVPEDALTASKVVELIKEYEEGTI
jgi:hypothetical protein